MPNMKTSNLESLKKIVWDYLFPNECLICAAKNKAICADCLSLFDLSPRHAPYRSPWLDDLYSATGYENRFANLAIKSFKFEPFWRELAPPLAELMISHLELIAKKPDFSDFTVIAAPIDKFRIPWRGFNQAKDLAACLAKKLNLTAVPGFLAKSGKNAPQSSLSAADRKKNILGKIKCTRPDAAAGMKFLLVDDILTTGATMEECARQLKKCGAQNVTGIVFARSEKPGG
jgi:competence protein ComFC